MLFLAAMRLDGKSSKEIHRKKFIPAANKSGLIFVVFCSVVTSCISPRYSFAALHDEPGG